MRMKIELTEAQREQLKPMFDLVHKNNSDGIACAIGAQVFTDGINVKIFTGDQGRALACALGGDYTEIVVSAEQAYQAGIKRDMEPKPTAEEQEAEFAQFEKEQMYGH